MDNCHGTSVSSHVCYWQDAPMCQNSPKSQFCSSANLPPRPANVWFHNQLPSKQQAAYFDRISNLKPSKFGLVQNSRKLHAMAANDCIESTALLEAGFGSSSWHAKSVTVVNKWTTKTSPQLKNLGYIPFVFGSEMAHKGTNQKRTLH